MIHYSVGSAEFHLGVGQMLAESATEKHSCSTGF